MVLCLTEIFEIGGDMSETVVLYSGGADSRLMLEFAHKMGKRVYCVLIDYGQLHKQELEVAKTQLESMGISYQLSSIGNLKVDSGLTGDGKKDTYEDVHEMHVPSRNLMFIGIAASIAENRGADTIWYGADFSDYLNEFPDCKQEWIGRVNKVLAINGPKPIKLEAPLSGLTKEDIISLLKNFGITEEEVFSGYGEL